ncbi:MAG TPA: hypothetical protein P5102_02890 [Candidatus Competibacteraceae bacterium]|nr:hypothetical protein [Candidatus Competibacteraceae bacterium]HRZ05092.1 hypothetical protein [Candidatus Competibacteraceae bacterium]HSA47562.1 hypothetical protein [Candidatus Competibacteraceae bacterium]
MNLNPLCLDPNDPACAKNRILAATDSLNNASAVLLQLMTWMEPDDGYQGEYLLLEIVRNAVRHANDLIHPTAEGEGAE